MFGYVRPNASRLSGDENERFRAAYCALCHTLGRRYGVAARFLLNFDFTVLAILLSLGEPTRDTCRRCAVHPCKGRRALKPSIALDTAAAYSVVLAWWQLQDHIADHGFFSGLKYRLAALLLRSSYRKARADAAGFDASAREHLRRLAEREAERCASLDEAAEPFAALLAEASAAEPDALKRRVLAQLFYHLGRWVYLVDAADDFADDAKTGAYNPLRYRYAIDGGALTEEAKRALGETLDASIRQMQSAYALLDAGEWTSVLDSIFYDSLYGIGNAVLKGVYRKPSRPRRDRTTKGEPV